MKKKIAITTAVIALIMVLCSFKYSNREGGEIRQDAEQIEKLHYCGHTYICYRFYRHSYKSGWGGASIVHDPDCKCGKGVQN